jgi:hypothetical protein
LGEDRLLYVCLPRDYEAGSASYPVLYVFYGDQIRGYFAEAVHVVGRLSGEGSIPRMIVVGVVNVDRYRDLSPVERPGRPSGIDAFSRFFEEELVPYVDSKYRTKGYRVLMGPQAGAEFGLYVLARRQGLFSAFIIENPFHTEATHDTLIPMLDEIMDAGLQSFTFLQITSADRAGYNDMTSQLEYVRGLEEKLTEKKPHNLKLVAHYIEGSEDFLPPLRLKEGLRELFREYRFPDGRKVSGLMDITAHYSALSKQFGFEVDVPEMTLISRSVELNEGGAADSAKVVLEYLVEQNPASLGGYWQLAHLHRELGDKETAIEYYRKCLEIMPNMGPAQQWIEKLQEGQ